MKRILIVSYFFAPGNIIGAVRASKISKYLEKMGYKVEVVCGYDNKLLYFPYKVHKDEILEEDTKYITKHVIRHSKAYQAVARLLLFFNKKFYKKQQHSFNSAVKKKGVHSIIRNYLKKIFQLASYIFSIMQDVDFFYMAKKVIRKIDCDIVISTYGPTGSHMVGAYYKKKNMNNTLWIADFRDPIAQPTNLRIQYLINKLFEKAICANADVVTAVSKGYLDSVTEGCTSINSYVITNGFDKNDLKGVEIPRASDILTFVYTGTTYGGRRNLGPLFQVIKDLITENKIEKNKVLFKYAGSESEYIVNLAKEYTLEDRILTYNTVPRIKALQIQASSSILIVATWNERNYKGVLPGKFLEYMMFSKPIIGIVNGSEEGSEIRKIISDYNLGCCYEEVNAGKDYSVLRNYVYAQYLSITNNGEVIYEGRKDLIRHHEYQYISERFAKIFELENLKHQGEMENNS